LNIPAILVLEDGTVFEGISVGAAGLSVGEVVFNTAMTGYQEILTDPSYARQLVTLTYPHIGNTGCTARTTKPTRVWAAGLIVRDVPRRPAAGAAEVALPEWLRARGIVAISGIDTRKLTRILRDRGAQNGALMAGDAPDASTWTRRGRTQVPRPERHGPGQGGQHRSQPTVARRPAWTSTAMPSCAPIRGSRSWPTTSGSSTTSCACWPNAVAT
jgi:carbamoylphosphate synthase small subunit